MKRTILTHILSFMLGLASGVGLQHLISVVSPSSPNETQTATNIVETNRVGTAKHNVEWFKNNSNYIWDGWKIK